MEAKREELNSHMEAVHKYGPYHCDKCGVMAAKKEDLWRHLVAVHRDRDYQCDKCDYSSE